MPDLTQREQSLLDSLTTRLEDADAFTVDGTLQEIENSQEYKNPSHPDHTAFLHMVPLAMGRQMELAGQAPNASGTDADSSMLDNQRFTHDIHPQDKPLDFSDEDQKYKTKRQNLTDTMTRIHDGTEPLHGVSKEDALKGVQSFMLEVDSQHDATLKARTDVLEQSEKQEQLWESEKVEKAAQMKTDFMATRLKGVLKDDIPLLTKQAETEWARLKSDYGF